MWVSSLGKKAARLKVLDRNVSGTPGIVGRQHGVWKRNRVKVMTAWPSRL